ncbi:MAG: carboxypeptidase regulatory-like domain-containing protein [Planctomycetes bacterium]|nr:carboxypeptidase regulatory-like domain-containing protein [Planctomycetota bacterium]
MKDNGKDGRTITDRSTTDGGASAGDGVGKTGEADEPPTSGSAGLSGKIIDENGNAYAGAIAIAKLGSRTFKSNPAGDDGVFTLPGLPAEKALQLCASTEDDDWSRYGPSRSITLAPGAQKLEPPLQMPRSRELHGRVIDAATREPVANVSLKIVAPRNDHGAGVVAWARSGNDGTFKTPGMIQVPGPYRVETAHAAYLPAILVNVAENADLTVEVEEGLALKGMVRDAANQTPIAGAKVTAVWTAEPDLRFVFETLSDAQGQFTLRARVGATNNDIYARAPGYSESILRGLRSETTDLRLDLRRNGNCIYRGRVFMPDGRPGAIGMVMCGNWNQRSGSTQIGNVGGDNSSFSIEAPMDADEIRIVDGRMEFPALVVSIKPVSGGDIDLGDLKFAKGVAVFGVVREATGDKKPIADVEVFAGSVFTTTAADGSYRLEKVGQPVTLKISTSNYASMMVQVAVPEGATEVRRDLFLNRPEHVAPVRVKDSEGAPIAGVRITLGSTAGEWFTDAKGEAWLRQLPLIGNRATFEKTGFVTVTRDVSSHIEDDMAAFNEVTLLRGGGIYGRFTSQGEPLPAGTRIEVKGHDPASSTFNSFKIVATVQTDADGKYTTDNLHAGDYWIAAPDFHMVPRKVVATEAGTEFNFDFGALCHVKGCITRHDGNAHGSLGVYVYERSQCGYVTTFYTDPDGRYEVRNLWPGNFVFCVLKTQADASAQFSIDVALGSDGNVTRDITLPKATGVITGRVTYTDGAPCGDARVAITNLTANFERALLSAFVVTDGQGYYRAERMENDASMMARVGGYSDGADTATAFSEAVIVAGDSTPVNADIVVAREARAISGSVHTASNGPLSQVLLYLIDSSGRVSGLYFAGTHFTISDVPPGNYRLVVTALGMKRLEIAVQVGAENIDAGLITLEIADR